MYLEILEKNDYPGKRAIRKIREYLEILENHDYLVEEGTFERFAPLPKSY